MHSGFVHLRVHTEYSLVDGLVRIKPLAAAVAQAGMPAVAVTDQANLFAMVKFYRAAQAAGIKPIIGVDACLRNSRETEQPFRLTLLCAGERGYRNLTQLVSDAYRKGQHRGVPLIQRDWIADASDGLIALSGGREGDIGRALLAGDDATARELARAWAKRFPDAFYIELQRTGRPDEEDYLYRAVQLAQALDLPVVATNDVRFLRRDDFDAHEARVCIHDGRTLDDARRPRRYSEQQYLRTPAEMQKLFADIPEALANSVEIAKRCNLGLRLGENYLPEFPVPEGTNADNFLRSEAHAGLAARLPRILEAAASDGADATRQYQERLDWELDVIIQMGFPGYFLIVADFIRWAKEHGIPVGPGRGSGAGSLVAYALSITDLDPIKYELLFERFLNPERVSMPDFDVDFCMDQRDRVIEYVAQRYGREKVSQIITYGSMAAKAAVRDVGRVMGHPYGFVDRIAKLIPFEIGITLDKALAQEEELRRLYKDDDEVGAVIDLARKLEGLARNAGKHAGGVVIAPSKLTDFTPLYCEQGSDSVVTQFDKDDVEAVGLVKFDFLGLRTLTIIDWAVQTINQQRSQRGETPVDISALPTDDAATFELLKRCATTAVFQLESRGMKDLIKRLQPDSFDEIVALVALFRPGPLQSGMVDDFIDRKHGARVEYPHPDLEPILKPTYGVILYQEQVMQIAQVLAGYTLGGADLLRRAMGKKKAEEMAKQRTIFTDGALKRGIDEKVATYIFDLMEKFAGYGFNKSHSAAYALVSYQTAWLKAHYPAAFMAAVLSSDMDNTDKVVTLIEECRDMHLQVVPPDVNTSFYRFTVANDDTILYGLGAIKGVGQNAIDCIIVERGANGPFKDLFDYCQRIDLRKANKRVQEALIRAGALDKMGKNRASLMAQLPEALKSAEQQSRNADAGMVDLFGAELESSTSADSRLLDLPDWDEDQRLIGEKETLGLYLTGHPIERYEDELARITSGRLAALTGAGEGWGGERRGQERSVVVAGLVINMRTVNTRRGGRMAIVTLDDRTARIEATLFPEMFDRFRNVIAKDRVLVMQGLLGPDDYTGGYRLSVENVYTVDQAREQYARRLEIQIGADKGGNGFIHSLAAALTPFRAGPCPVWVQYRGAGAEARLPLGQEWRVRPTDELLSRLRELAGAEQVHVVYEA